MIEPKVLSSAEVAAVLVKHSATARGPWRHHVEDLPALCASHELLRTEVERLRELSENNEKPLPAAGCSRIPCEACREFLVKLLTDRMKRILDVYRRDAGGSHCFHLMEIRGILEGKQTSGVYDDYGPTAETSGLLSSQGARLRDAAGNQKENR